MILYGDELSRWRTTIYRPLRLFIQCVGVYYIYLQGVFSIHDLWLCSCCNCCIRLNHINADTSFFFRREKGGEECLSCRSLNHDELKCLILNPFLISTFHRVLRDLSDWNILWFLCVGAVRFLITDTLTDVAKKVSTKLHISIRLLPEVMGHAARNVVTSQITVYVIPAS
jgi:hypothetical protein